MKKASVALNGSRSNDCAVSVGKDLPRMRNLIVLVFVVILDDAKCINPESEFMS